MSADGHKQWFPHVTVASIASRDNRYLMVRETYRGNTVVNQPAGHVEQGESLEQAVIRETLEETGWQFNPTELVGIYQFIASNGETYIRFAYHGELTGQSENATIDPVIEEVVWLERAQIESEDIELRNNVVLQCIKDFEAGKRLPHDTIQALGYPV